MEELTPGLWTWTAPHPDWTPEQGGPDGWERDVRSYAYDARDSLVLFDPLVSPIDVRDLADGRPVVVVLTSEWHARSARELVAQLEATVHAPTANLRDAGVAALPYELGDDLPGDVEPHVGGYPDEATLWIREHRALVIGDVFLGWGERGFRVQPDSWLAEGLTAQELREQLQPLLELPVELLLPTHGNPVTENARETLRRARPRLSRRLSSNFESGDRKPVATLRASYLGVPGSARLVDLLGPAVRLPLAVQEREHRPSEIGVEEDVVVGQVGQDRETIG
jgi:hypothetical protein